MFRRNRKRAPGVRGASALRRRRRLGEGFISGRHLLLECLEPRRLLSLSPIISEVDPGNKSGIIGSAGKRGRLAGDLQSRPDRGRQPHRLVDQLRQDRRQRQLIVDLPHQHDPWSRRVPRDLRRFELHFYRVERGDRAGRVGHGLQSQQGRRYARAAQFQRRSGLVAHLPVLELRHLLRPGGDGQRNGPRRGGGHSVVLHADQ